LELLEVSVMTYLDVRFNNFRTYPKIFFFVLLEK